MAHELPPKKGPQMATVAKPLVPKSAEDELLESFGKTIDSAAEKMTHRKFMKTAKESKAALDQAIAARPRRRGTA
jgi:hypothetical protein